MSAVRPDRSSSSRSIRSRNERSRSPATPPAFAIVPPQSRRPLRRPVPKPADNISADGESQGPDGCSISLILPRKRGFRADARRFLWTPLSRGSNKKRRLRLTSVLVRRREGFLLLGRSLLLVLRLPLVIGHAVDDLAGLGVAERDAALLGGRPVPFGQAIAAEAGEVHQVDVLYIRALAQMRDQLPEGGGLQFDARLVVHGDLQCGQYRRVYVIGSRRKPAPPGGVPRRGRRTPVPSGRHCRPARPRSGTAAGRRRRAGPCRHCR